MEAKQQIVDNEPDQILIPQDIAEELVEDQRIAVGERNREKTQRLNIGHDVWQTLVTNESEPTESKSVRDQILEREKREQRENFKAKLKLRAKSMRAYLRTRGGSNESSLPSGLVPKNDVQEIILLIVKFGWKPGEKKCLD